MSEQPDEPVRTRPTDGSPARDGASRPDSDAEVDGGPRADEEAAAEPSRADLAMDALARVRRPVEMYVAGVFLTLAALPLVLVGAALLLQVGAIGENLRQRLTEAGSGLDVGSLILLFRMGGGVLLLIGLLFLAFTWAALRPKRWARTGATVLAVVEILLLVGAMVVTTVDPVSLGIVLLAGAGVVLLHLPHSEEFLLTSR